MSDDAPPADEPDAAAEAVDDEDDDDDIYLGPEEDDDEEEDSAADDPLAFVPVPVRARHDGWTPAKQVEFIEALAATGCVDTACQWVGRSSQGVYKLRVRADAESFRLAWEAALDVGISRLSDAAISRAIHGVPVPHFYKGEQVGEHRRYDERLTMWMLRYRDPVRYGKWLDRMEMRQPADGPVKILARRALELWQDCFGLLKDRLHVGPRYGQDEAQAAADAAWERDYGG